MPRRSVLQAYRDAEKTTSVPAFVVPADQIIKNLNSTASARNDKTPVKFNFNRRLAGRPSVTKQAADKALRTPSNMLVIRSRSRVTTLTPGTRPGPLTNNPQAICTAATGTNRQPLGLLSGNKRAAHGPADLPSPAPKRFRIGDFGRRSQTGQNVPTDLTANPPIASRAQVHPPPFQGLSKKARKKARARALLEPPPRIEEQTTQTETISTLARTASRLYASAADLDTNRGVLRQRWEIDDDLKDQHVTDVLGDLNGCLQRAEEAIRHGAAIIEDKVLRRS